MTTGTLTAFPIPTNDSLSAFGIMPSAGGTFSGGISVNGAIPTWTTTGARVNIGNGGSFPAVQFMYAAGGTDAKGWDTYAGANVLVSRLLNDANSGATTWRTVTRAGMTVADITWTATALNMNGAVTVTRGAIDSVKNLSGSASIGQSYALGRATVETYLGISGSASTFTTGDAAGDTSLRFAQRLYISLNSTSLVKIDGTSVRFDQVVDMQGPMKFGAYTLATMPSAAAYSGYCIEVSNATGGPKVCRSNGTVWQILNTSTQVS